MWHDRKWHDMTWHDMSEWVQFMHESQVKKRVLHILQFNEHIESERWEYSLKIQQNKCFLSDIKHKHINLQRFICHLVCRSYSFFMYAYVFKASKISIEACSTTSVSSIMYNNSSNNFAPIRISIRGRVLYEWNSLPYWLYSSMFPMIYLIVIVVTLHQYGWVPLRGRFSFERDPIALPIVFINVSKTCSQTHIWRKQISPSDSVTQCHESDVNDFT